MKQTRLFVLMVLLIVGTGCVRRLPSAAESFGGRTVTGVPSCESLVPLSVPEMIEPGIIPVRHEIGDEQRLLAIFFIYWKPCRASLVPKRIYQVTKSMFAEQIFFPVWGKPVGVDEALELADQRLSWLVNSRLKVEGLDTVVEIELILVQVSIGETGETRYTWTKCATPE